MQDLEQKTVKSPVLQWILSWGAEKGGPGSGNWAHTSFQREADGLRGGSDPAGTAGGGLAVLGLGPDSAVEERQWASEGVRQDRVQNALNRFYQARDFSTSVGGLYDLDTWAGEQYGAWNEQLTTENRRGLYYYSDKGFEAINDRLRHPEDPEFQESNKINDFVRGRMEWLDGAMEGASVPEDVLVTRMVKTKVWEQIQDTPVGGTFLDKGYTSTSFDPKVSISASHVGQLIIHVPKGTRAAYLGRSDWDLTRYAKEYELLLDKGTRFIVLKKTPTQVTIGIVGQGEKGGPGSGNWGHTSLQRVGEGRGGSDPAGTLGGGLGVLGLGPESTPEERRVAAAALRRGDRSGMVKAAAGRLDKARRVSTLESVGMEGDPGATAWGKEAYGEWMDSVTRDEKQAIRAYTGYQYQQINGLLRRKEEITSKMHPVEMDRTSGQVEQIDKALGRATVPEDLHVARRVGKDAMERMRAMKPGETFRDDGYTSTTVNAPLQEFRPGDQVHILVPQGTRGAYIGAHGKGMTGRPDEMELLLARGSRFMVLENEPGKAIKLALVGQRRPGDIRSEVADLRAQAAAQAEAQAALMSGGKGDSPGALKGDPLGALKGGPGSGNWAHTSLQRVGVGRGGSDPAGSGGAVAMIGLPLDSTIDERREASRRVRAERPAPRKDLTVNALRKRLDGARRFEPGTQSWMVEPMTKWSDEHYDAWRTDLLQNHYEREYRGLKEYVGSGYEMVNIYLRRGEKPFKGRFGSLPPEKATNLAYRLDDALSRAPAIPEDVIAYRTVKPYIAEHMIKSGVGSVVTDMGFASVTLNEHIKPVTPGASQTLRVLLPKGTKGAALCGESVFGATINFNTVEAEILLARGMRFMVLETGPQITLAAIGTAEKSLHVKGGPGSGNWAHTSLQRVGVGRGGSDPAGQGGAVGGILGFALDSSVEDRRQASERIRAQRKRDEAKKKPKGKKPDVFEINALEDRLMNAPQVQIGNLDKRKEAFYEFAHASYDEWYNALSDQEVGAIRSYTVADYAGINNYLRKDDPDGYNVQSLDRMTELIDSALNKAPELQEDRRLLRGIKEKAWLQIENLEPGDTFVDKGLASTTVADTTTFGFKRLLILAPKGTKGAPMYSFLTSYDDETEFLLPAGTRFMVLGKTPTTVRAVIVGQGVKELGEKQVERLVPAPGGVREPLDPEIVEEDVDRAVDKYSALIPMLGDLFAAKAMAGQKGGPGSGNWGHTSFQRMGVGKGGSDPAGSFGGGLASIGLDPDYIVGPEMRRMMSDMTREARFKPGTIRKRMESTPKFYSADNDDDLVDWAEEHYGDWAEKLDPFEVDAIGEYTDDAFVSVNKRLRGKESIALSNPRFTDIIAGMDSAMEEAGTTPVDLTVRRGFGASIKAKILAMEPGQTFVDKGFTSTSMDSEWHWHREKVSATILVPKGTRAMYVGHEDWKLTSLVQESELILDRGTRFMMIEKSGNNVVLAVVGQAEKAFSGKGGTGSGNWAHTSLQRLGVGRGGSDPAGTGGALINNLGLAGDASIDERREMSAEIRKYRREQEAKKPKNAKKVEVWKERQDAVPAIVDRTSQTTQKAEVFGRQFYSGWNHSLSDEEQDAIRAYAGSGFGNMNRLLRKGSGHMKEDLDRPDDTEADVRKRIDVVAGALNRGLIPQDMNVVRGTREEFMSQIRDLPVGSTFVDKGFTSTSMHNMDWMGEGNNVHILLPKGTKAGFLGVESWHLSGMPYEAEVLLPPGSRFMVLDKAKNGDVFVALVGQGQKELGGKGGTGSGNWAHTSLQRLGVGRGGSDPAGTGGAVAGLGLDLSSTIEERREASQQKREERNKPKAGSDMESLKKRLEKARQLPGGDRNQERDEWGIEHFGPLFKKYGGLKKEETWEEGIGTYSGGGYSDINKHLRGKISPDEPLSYYWSTPENTEHMIGLMDQVMSDPRARVPEDMVAWRRFGYHMRDEIDALKPGDLFTDKGFSSTTTRDDFVFHPGADIRQVRILVPQGTRGVYIGVDGWGTLSYESELLLDRGTQYMVLDKTPQLTTLAVVGQAEKALDFSEKTAYLGEFEPKIASTWAELG